MGTARGTAAAALAVLTTAAALLVGAPATAAPGDEPTVTTAVEAAATGVGGLMTVYRDEVGDGYALGIATPRGDARSKVDHRPLRKLTGAYQDIDAAEVLSPGRGSAVLLLGSGASDSWSVLEHRSPTGAPQVLATGRLSRSYHTAALLEHGGRGYALFVGYDASAVNTGYYALMALDPRSGALRLASTGTMTGGHPWEVSDLGGGEAVSVMWQWTGSHYDDTVTSSSLQRWRVEGTGTSARLVRTAVTPLSQVYWAAERVETDGSATTREVVLHGSGPGYSVVRYRATGGASFVGRGSLPYAQSFPSMHQLGDPDAGVSPLIAGAFFTEQARVMTVSGPAAFAAGVTARVPLGDAAWVVAPTAP